MEQETPDGQNVVPQTPKEISPKTRFKFANPVKRFDRKTIVIAVAIALVLAAGIWKLVLSKNMTTPVGQTRITESSSSATSDVPNTSQTKQYENGFLGLNLSYPATWTVTEPEDKDAVKLESPDFRYETIDVGVVTGNFRVYIRKGARTEDSKYIGRGLAIKPSEKLTYLRPVAGQRTDTLLSSFGLDATENFAFFLVAGNFQLNTGESLGPNYGKEAETFIITGGYSAKELKDDLQTNTVPTSGYDQTNAYSQAIEIVKSLQLH